MILHQSDILVKENKTLAFLILRLSRYCTALGHVIKLQTQVGGEMVHQPQVSRPDSALPSPIVIWLLGFSSVLSLIEFRFR
jgi:hypothetical protein